MAPGAARGGRRACALALALLSIQSFARLRTVEVVDMSGLPQWSESSSARPHWFQSIVTSTNATPAGGPLVAAQTTMEQEVTMYAQFTLLLVYELQGDVLADGFRSMQVSREATLIERTLLDMPAWSNFCGRAEPRHRRLCNPGHSLASYMMPKLTASRDGAAPDRISLEGHGGDAVPFALAWQLLMRHGVDKVLLPAKRWRGAGAELASWDLQDAPATLPWAFRSAFTFTLAACTSSDPEHVQRRALDAASEDWLAFVEGDLLPRLEQIRDDVDAMERPLFRFWFDGEGVASLQADRFLTEQAWHVAIATGLLVGILLTLRTGSLLLGPLGLGLCGLAGLVAHGLSAASSRRSFAALTLPCLATGWTAEVVVSAFSEWEVVRKASAGGEARGCQSFAAACPCVWRGVARTLAGAPALVVAAVFVDDASVRQCVGAVFLWVFALASLIMAVFLPMCIVEARLGMPLRIDLWRLGRLARGSRGKAPRPPGGGPQEAAVPPPDAPAPGFLASSPATSPSVSLCSEEDSLEGARPFRGTRAHPDLPDAGSMWGGFAAWLVLLLLVVTLSLSDHVSVMGQLFPADHNQVQGRMAFGSFVSVPELTTQSIWNNPPPAEEACCSLHDFDESPWRGAEASSAPKCSMMTCEADAGETRAEASGCRCYRQARSSPCARPGFVRRIVADDAVGMGDLARAAARAFAERPLDEPTQDAAASAREAARRGAKLAILQSWETGAREQQQVFEIRGSWSVEAELLGPMDSDAGELNDSSDNASAGTGTGEEGAGATSSDGCWVELCFCGQWECKLPPQFVPSGSLQLTGAADTGAPPPQPPAAEQPSEPLQPRSATVRHEVQVVVGLSAQDTGLLAKPEFDNRFRPANLWAQRSMYLLCADVPPELLVTRTTCWMEDFKVWLHNRGELFPVLDDAPGARGVHWDPHSVGAESLKFHRRAMEFVKDSASNDARQAAGLPSIPDTLWMRDQKLRAFYIGYEVEIPANWTADESARYRRAWDKFVHTWNQGAHAFAGQAWHDSQLWAIDDSPGRSVGAPPPPPANAGLRIVGGIFCVLLPAVGAGLSSCSARVLTTLVIGLAGTCSFCVLLFRCLPGVAVTPLQATVVFVTCGYSGMYAVLATSEHPSSERRSMRIDETWLWGWLCWATAASSRPTGRPPPILVTLDAACRFADTNPAARALIHAARWARPPALPRREAARRVALSGLLSAGCAAPLVFNASPAIRLCGVAGVSTIVFSAALAAGLLFLGSKSSPRWRSDAQRSVDDPREFPATPPRPARRAEERRRPEERRHGADRSAAGVGDIADVFAEAPPAMRLGYDSGATETSDSFAEAPRGGESFPALTYSVSTSSPSMWPSLARHGGAQRGGSTVVF